MLSAPYSAPTRSLATLFFSAPIVALRPLCGSRAVRQDPTAQAVAEALVAGCSTLGLSAAVMAGGALPPGMELDGARAITEHVYEGAYQVGGRVCGLACGLAGGGVGVCGEMWGGMGHWGSRVRWRVPDGRVRLVRRVG